ncbi:MAG: hypothetical protein OXN15_02815 [Chloroflexota bacterium]|nr:hypothetical protein [Chloroflexota bacterium]MDE2968497.1 hypothetical protein [Chloroflexota bacterium]
MAAPSDNDTTKDKSLPEDALTAHTDSAPKGSPDPQPPDVSDEEDQEDLLDDIAIAEEVLAHRKAYGYSDTRPYSEYRAERLASDA